MTDNAVAIYRAGLTGNQTYGADKKVIWNVADKTIAGLTLEANKEIFTLEAGYFWEVRFHTYGAVATCSLQIYEEGVGYKANYVPANNGAEAAGVFAFDLSALSSPSGDVDVSIRFTTDWAGSGEIVAEKTAIMFTKVEI